VSLINDTLKEIEKIKASISDLEEKLAEELRQELLAVEQVNQWNDPVPSVKEEEPMSDPIETRMEDAGIEFENKTPPRSDLKCPLCDKKVFDNRPQKLSGEYKPKSPDFVCSNRETCSGLKQGDYGMLRKSWWLNSKDLPQDWIETKVPHNPDATYVDTTKQETQKESPF
jgi:hypothetical protein|tara:strand:- start:872 stop:1381 length:510 start_codon:yes stop_codon:yes gene_type:complete